MDKLALYRGQDVYINKYLIMRQPTIGEICDYGEEQYFNMISCLTQIPSDVKYPLFKIGLDYETVSDFQLFCMQAPNLKPDETKIIFGDLDFTKFFVMPHPTEPEQMVLAQYVDETDEVIFIDEVIYMIIMDFLRSMHGIVPKVEKAFNELTKQVLIEESRLKFENKNTKPFESHIFNYAATLVVHGICNFETIWDIKYYAFNDILRRFAEMKQIEFRYSAMASGCLDRHSLKDKDLNWFKDPT